MLDALALLLLANAAGLQADVGTTELPRIFIDACLDGQARLSPGSAQRVGFDALPGELRQGLGSPASAQVWRLNGAGHAFLYVLDYPAAPKANPRICGLASDELNYRAAADAIEARVAGAAYPKTNSSIQWMDPDAGYTAFVTRAGEFKVLQVNWMSEQQRAEAVKTYRPIMP
jgi:hypothetical protein